MVSSGGDARASVRICFVCLGNICRSPTAEGVMRALVERAGLGERVLVDSAGTAGYHTGEPSDSRSIAHAKRRGYALTHLARTFTRSDFARFDYVVAMDGANYRSLQHIAPDAAARAKISMLRAYEIAEEERSRREGHAFDEVPDPYYGGADGFERVLDICEAGCSALLAHVRAKHTIT